MAVIISRRSFYCPNFATALRNMGWTMTDEQEQDIYYLWKVVGRMVGIAEDLMKSNDDIASSERIMDAIHSVDGEPDQASQDLVDALMSGFVVNVNAHTEVPEESLADWTAAYTRIIHGDEVADKVGDVWGFNEEGEMRTIWQRSGHPGFWFHGGNLAMCRYYSRLLALQIKGLEEGLYEVDEV